MDDPEVLVVLHYKRNLGCTHLWRKSSWQLSPISSSFRTVSLIYLKRFWRERVEINWVVSRNKYTWLLLMHLRLLSAKCGSSSSSKYDDVGSVSLELECHVNTKLSKVQKVGWFTNCEENTWALIGHVFGMCCTAAMVSLSRVYITISLYYHHHHY